MKRPLITVALLYVLGLLLGNYFSPPLVVLFLAAFASLIPAFLFPRNVSVWPVIILLGWINFASRSSIISPHDLRSLIGDQPRYVTIRGVLMETPRHRIFEMNDVETSRTMARIQVTDLKDGQQWTNATGQIMASTGGRLPENVFKHQAIEVTGVLQIPRRPLAEGLFDYRTYLQRQGIHYQLNVESSSDWTIIGPQQKPPWSDRFFLWAQNNLQRGLTEQDEPLRLLWAMTLGWKTALTDDVSEPFMKSGTMHIFAISGLHIALISGILVALLRVAQLPRQYCALIVIPLIWFYTGATGWQSSAIRSTIMMTIVVGGWSLNRPSDLLNSLAAAALLILVWDPLQLFQASFQLSFFVVLSMALVLPVFHRYRERLLNPDPLLPPDLRAPWRKWLDYPLNFVTTAFATSLAAWLGSLPLIAYYFHLCTPVSLLSNFVIVPLSGFALMSNLGSLLCGLWFPFATELFNNSGWFFMKLMADSSRWFASLPYGYFYVPSPSISACALYYLLLFTLLNGWLFLPGKRLVPIALAILGVIWGTWHGFTQSRTVKVTILPLNGGDAVYVDAPGRKNDLLIDCGNESSAKFILEPFLRAQGVNSLENLVLTHGDLRHIGGADLVINHFKIKNVFASPAKARSATYRNLVSTLQQNSTSLQSIKANDRLNRWTVLHPDDDNFPQADDNALVLLGEFFGNTILLASDLGRSGQNSLLDRHPGLRSRFLISGLPTQSEPVGHHLLNTVDADLLFIADAEFPATERASAKLRERLSQHSTPALFGREAGAITFIFSRRGCKIKTALGGPVFIEQR